MVSQITIGGVPGSGKTTVAKLLAEASGYKFWSGGLIRREMASKRGLTIEEFNALPENTDEELDNFTKNELGKMDEIIFEGRLGFLFLPSALKIYFYCDPQEAANRIFNDPRTSESTYSSVEELKQGIASRMANDSERYSKYYGVDCYDPSKFDYVIDTTNLTSEQVVSKVLELLS